MLAVPWGNPTDIPVQGDFDGDGASDPAVYRPTTGTWYVATAASNYQTTIQQAWGSYGDQPTPADYDGDGITDFSVWRPTSGVWFTIRSSDSTYEYQTLGVPGDTAIPSSFTKQVGSTVSGYDMATARLSPKNATGGTNLYSQNFSWGTSLVSLPGRSGLNAGFGISYNSLVWIKSGSAMYFDPDTSNVTPGFRLGFPVIEPVYYDSGKQLWAYMMVAPDGSRREFRQVGAGNTYETADSSYTQLVTTGASNPNDPVENITIKVTGTDGTQMSYYWRAGAFRCNRILDRNGNYIDITHDPYGKLTLVVDTLGRQIVVNYDANFYPTSITQTWKGTNGSGANTTHTWATFEYEPPLTVTTNFGNLTVFGPPNGTTLKVLRKVKYADDSYTEFLYNSYAQVRQIENHASNGNKLNHVRTDLDSVSGVQSDCPRFFQTDTFAEDFNGGNVVRINNTFATGQSYTLPDNSPATGTRIEIKSPDGAGNADALVTKIYSNSSGWAEAMPVLTEDFATESSTLVKKRWTWTNWEQDQIGMTPYSFPVNPRIIETRVGDGTNTKRTTMTYIQAGPDCGMFGGGEEPEEGTNVACYGLVNEVDLYDTDLSTILKKSTTSYNFNMQYLNKRLIGLPTQTMVYGKEGSLLPLVSKITYAYDEGGYTGAGQAVSPTQRDPSYGTSFSKRGNLTSTTRCDAGLSLTTCVGGVTSRVKYNTAGSPISQTDPLNRVTTISYADVWNDNVTRTTYAYPTSITDPGNNSSTIKYRFDLGANVEATSPAPAGNTHGKTSKRVFDSLGRLERESIYVDTTEKAYTRYEYPTSGIYHKSYTPVIDADGDGSLAEDEVLSESWTDGAGRVLASRSPHTFNGDGTTATWAGSQVRYDILGRVTKQSVPTEVASIPNLANLDAWQAVGDDDTRGWLWTHQKYDWNNRVIRKINTDGADSPTLNDSDILISYDDSLRVTTVEAERVPIPGTSTFARRKQRVYEDNLGRTYKTEVLNWNGSVDSASQDVFNGRDQVVSTTQFDGAGPTARQVVMTYDGHGRMKTRHYPIEDAGVNTTWNYNADDTIQNVTDPRGVVTTFGYNSRGMMTGISYDPGSTGVEDTPDVTFAFDNIGNRTSMTDGTGSTSYVYNSLSQITSETKYISELNNSFTINYTYALNGGVESYTDPQDPLRNVEYEFDRLGRITEARNTYQGTVLQKLHETQYRAWGALKKHTFVNIGTAVTTNRPVEFEYDNRLQVSRHFAPNTATPSTPFHDIEYTRNADGKVKLSTDVRSASFTRNFEYDHLGRVTKSLSGGAIENSPPEAGTPYRTTIAYNSFSDETSVTGKHWEVINPPYLPTVSLSTGRLSNSSYDASGNVTGEPVPFLTNPRTYAYDAAGRNTSGIDPGRRNNEYNRYLTATYDGNGWRVKDQTFIFTPPTTHTKTTFEFSSTVLGGETVGSWTFSDDPSFFQRKTFTATANGVKLVHKTGPEFEWLSPEGTTMYDGYAVQQEEFDIRGGALGTENPYNSGGSYGGGGSYGDAEFYSACAWDGKPVQCSVVGKVFNYMHYIYPGKSKRRDTNSVAEHAPATTSRPSTTTETDKPTTEPAKNETIAPALDPNNFVASLNMDWVYANGQVFFDSRVVDQKSATEIYGGGAKYWEIGTAYVDSNGDDIELGEYGFFTKNGQVDSSVDRADTASKILAADHSAWIMSGGLMIAGGLAADDITGIGVLDDPAIPFVLASATVAALAAKMTYEISKTQERAAGPQGVQYSLRATATGDYLCFRCSSGTMNLNAGDIWKFGQTINPTTRYTDAQLSTIAGRQVAQFNEFSGNQVEIMMAEKVKIYAYFAARGHLPPGNRIFR